MPRDAAYESSSVEAIAVNICRLEGCKGTIKLVRLLLKTFRQKLMLFICIRLNLTATIRLHLATKKFQTKEEILEDLYTYD